MTTMNKLFQNGTSSRKPDKYKCRTLGKTRLGLTTIHKTPLTKDMFLHRSLKLWDWGGGIFCLECTATTTTTQSFDVFKRSQVSSLPSRENSGSTVNVREKLYLSHHKICKEQCTSGQLVSIFFEICRTYATVWHNGKKRLVAMIHQDALPYNHLTIYCLPSPPKCVHFECLAIFSTS